MRGLIANGSERGGTAGLARMIDDALLSRGVGADVRAAPDVWSAAPTVWLVSNGPLDDSARTGTLPPVRHVAKAMSAIGARGRVTFGGRLAPDATSFPAGAMAKTRPAIGATRSRSASSPTRWWPLSPRRRGVS